MNKFTILLIFLFNLLIFSSSTSDFIARASLCVLAHVTLSCMLLFIGHCLIREIILFQGIGALISHLAVENARVRSQGNHI